MADEGQKTGDSSPKAIFDDATGIEAFVAKLDADAAVQDTKMRDCLSPKLAAGRSQQEEGKVDDAQPKSTSPSRSPSRERKRRRRSRSRSRTRRRSRSPRNRNRRNDRRSDRRRSRSRSPRGRRDRGDGDRNRDRDRRRSRSPHGDRRGRYRSRSRSRDNRRRRRRSPSSSRSRSRSHGRAQAAAYPSAGTTSAVAASLFPNMLPSGMNPMTATMPNMPNLHTVQMQNMAAAVGAMAGVSL